jgi:hypothetical protein
MENINIRVMETLLGYKKIIYLQNFWLWKIKEEMLMVYINLYICIYTGPMKAANCFKLLAPEFYI